MRRVSRQLARTGALDVIATAVPGLKDLLVLGKVKQLERAAAAGQPGPVGEPPADLIIVDAPAAGHAVTFLQSASGLRDAVTVGPIRGQAQEVADLLADASRCRVVLVTLPEETPVNECVETANALEDRVGLKLGPVVVNSVFPDAAWLDLDPLEVAAAAGVLIGENEAAALRQAARVRQRRHLAHAAQQARLAESLPLPQLSLPYLFAEKIGPLELDRLAGAFAAEVDRLDDPAPVA
jgi:anion-transporting  ArsA/GET3 family ATPase